MQVFSKLSIIIPAYNEEATMLQILQKIVAVNIGPISKEIIIVDDHSADNTTGIVEAFIEKHSELNVQLIRQSENLGKGAALHKGIKMASGDYILIQDADLEYNPEDYKLLIEPVLANTSEVVYGSRFAKTSKMEAMDQLAFIRKFILNCIIKLLHGLHLSDMETCYKLFPSYVIKAIPLKEKRFGFEPEITAKIARIKNIRLSEVPISYYGRSYHEGKKINAKDGFRAIYCILKYS